MVLLASAGYAQDTPPKPTAPFLAKLPAAANWRMDFTLLQPLPAPPIHGTIPGTAHKKPEAPHSKKQFQVTRTGDVSLELTTWSDGTSTQLWRTKGVLFLKAPPSTYYAILPESDDPSPTAQPDFRDLGWVDLNHFTGVKQINGQNCYVYTTQEYRSPFPYDGDPPRNAHAEEATVWISVDTKLPVAWQDPYYRAAYTFALPVPALALPGECQTIMDSIAACARRLAGEKMVLPH